MTSKTSWIDQYAVFNGAGQFMHFADSDEIPMSKNCYCYRIESEYNLDVCAARIDGLNAEVYVDGLAMLKHIKQMGWLRRAWLAITNNFERVL